jgi:energy-coupling factor transporter ATP-binding protein EcfA2
MSMFKKAVRRNLKARLALVGPTGSGKTYTALSLASVLAEGGRIAVIDTERSSSDRYADIFSFDACQLTKYSPENYLKAIKGASDYSVLVIDSLSHAWEGVDGILEQVQSVAKRSKSGNTFAAWGDVTPIHRRLIDTILDFPGHIIITMRVKMEYIQEKNERTQKTEIRKVGLAPVQRQGLEYEFDIVADMDQEHNLIISKTRASILDGLCENKPGKELGQKILGWANGGEPVEDLKPEPSAAKKQREMVYQVKCPCCNTLYQLAELEQKPSQKTGMPAAKCKMPNCKATKGGWFSVQENLVINK